MFCTVLQPVIRRISSPFPHDLHTIFIHRSGQIFPEPFRSDSVGNSGLGRARNGRKTGGTAKRAEKSAIGRRQWESGQFSASASAIAVAFAALINAQRVWHVERRLNVAGRAAAAKSAAAGFKFWLRRGRSRCRADVNRAQHLQCFELVFGFRRDEADRIAS